MKGVQGGLKFGVFLAQHQRGWPHPADLLPFHHSLDPPVWICSASESGDGFAGVGKVVEVPASECCVKGAVGHLPHLVIGGEMSDFGIRGCLINKFTPVGFHILIRWYGVCFQLLAQAIACSVQRSITVFFEIPMCHLMGQAFQRSPAQV